MAAAPSVRSVSGTEYVVSGEADFQGAIVEIENAAESEATIVFKSGFDVSGFNGVAGKHITLKSETNAVSITNMGTSLVGGLTLDNVEAYTSSSNIYANGHRFETTERFAGTIGKLYGGGEQDVTSGGTSLVLRGGTFYYVYGGGNNANVKGDTHVLLDGATAWSLIGGGYGQEAGKGNVDGSSYLHILSGQVGADNRWPDNVYIYAGGYNSTKANPETIAVVTGDSHLIIGGQGGVDGDIVYPERSYKLYAGSYFSTVEGNTYLTMGQGSQLHNDSTSTTGGYYPTLYGGGQGGYHRRLRSG